MAWAGTTAALIHESLASGFLEEMVLIVSPPALSLKVNALETTRKITDCCPELRHDMLAEFTKLACLCFNSTQSKKSPEGFPSVSNGVQALYLNERPPSG